MLKCTNEFLRWRKHKIDRVDLFSNCFLVKVVGFLSNNYPFCIYFRGQKLYNDTPHDIFWINIFGINVLPDKFPNWNLFSLTIVLTEDCQTFPGSLSWLIFIKLSTMMHGLPFVNLLWPFFDRFMNFQDNWMFIC